MCSLHHGDAPNERLYISSWHIMLFLLIVHVWWLIFVTKQSTLEEPIFTMLSLKLIKRNKTKEPS